MAKHSTLPAISLDDAVGPWLARKAKSPATHRAYETTYKAFVADLESRGRPTDDLDAISGDDILDYLDTIPTDSTRKLRHYALRSLFTFHQRRLTVHPFQQIDTPETVRRDPRAHLLWPDLYRMLDTTRRDVTRKVNNGHRDRAVLELLATSGLRRAEVAGLALSDIDGQAITVRVAVAKGGKPRTARMDPEAAEHVEDYIIDIRGRPGSRGGHEHRDSERLFLGLAGPMTGQGIGDVVRRRARMAGLAEPLPTAHELRHLWRATCADCEIPRETVEALAGWLSDSKMADHYGAADIPRRAATQYDRLWRRPARR